MAAIASSDLTLTLQTSFREGTRKAAVYRIAFGDGSLTYPSGGVPLPSAASFGMTWELTYVRLLDHDDASGIIWKYDYANKKLRGYIQGTVISAAGAATLDDYAINTATETLAAAANQPGGGAVVLGLGNTTAAGTIYIGKLVELTTTHAPAAQTLYVEAVGF